MAAQKKTSRTTKPAEKPRKTSKPKASVLLKSLPESVENIEMVQQVAGILAELQNRVLDVKEEASKELKKLMKRYETHYKGLEKRVHDVTVDAKKQAQTSMIHILQKWHEHKVKLPKPLMLEIEKIIDQIGAKMAKTKTVKQKPARAKPAKTTQRKAAGAKVVSTSRAPRIKAKSKSTSSSGNE